MGKIVRFSFRRKRIFLLGFCCALCVFLNLKPSFVSGQESKRVLLLCSYHQGDPWEDWIVQGVYSVLEEKEAEIHVEYLDTIRHNREECIAHFRSLLKSKFDCLPFHLIISADDYALDFLLEHRKDFSPNIPIIFCGINDFRYERIAGHRNITGVNEIMDIEGTIKIALLLHPKAKNLVAIVGGDLPQWRRLLELFRKVAPSFSDRVKIQEIMNLDMAEAPSVLRAVPPDSIVLSLGGAKGDGRGEDVRTSLFRFLSEHSAAPVYCPWEFALGTGIVGGKMVSGFSQGEAAAQMARRILEGEPVSNIPVLLKSPSIPMFDWNALKRFGIPEKDLPPGSQVFFRPFSLYDRYRIWFWIIPGFIVIESWLLFTLLISRRRRAEVTRALIESEEKYKDLYEEAPVGYMEHNTKGLITRVNRRELEMLGYTVKEMVGKPVWSFDMEKEEAQKLTMAKLMGDRAPSKNLERTYIKKDGTTFPGLMEDVVLRDKTGRIVGIRSTIQDITDLKQAEEGQKGLQAQLSNAVEIANLAPWEYDIASDLFTFNDHFYKVLRTTAEEMGGYTMSSEEHARRFVHPDDIEDLESVYEAIEAMDPGSGQRIEHKIVFGDGTVGYVSIKSNIIKDSEGNPVRIYGVDQDITESKQAEIERGKLQAQLSNAVELAHLGPWEYDVASDLFTFNDYFYKIFRTAAEEVGGYTMSSDEYAQRFLHPDDIHLVGEETRKAIEATDPNYSRQTEHRILYADGTVGYISVRFFIVKDASGRTIKTYGVNQDITERKQVEDRLRESEEKLARSKKMESLGILAGGVAHDLNNVLAGIVSYPELLLLELPEDSRLRKPIRTIQESGDRAVAIVQDLLTVARGVASTRETTNLNDIIKEYLTSPEFKKLEQFCPAITVKTNLDTDLLNVNGSPVHIRKVIMNLVSNASEAVEVGGNVMISTMNRYVDRPITGYEDVSIGEYAVLAVSDDGSGISSDHLERIFEPFFSKKVMGRSGTGLGLAVVWNIVQDHEGYIDVSSDEKGTSFEIYFPITRDEVTEEDVSISMEDYKGKGETILVVDDVESQREITCKMLDALGYRSKAVSSGEEAVEYLREHRVDLVLLDMIMDPGINGRETYQRIIKIHPNQKAIIVSGFAETDEVKKTQRLGAGKYVKKPLKLQDIGLAIKNELERS
jgi:PAS domain S-box-containing protein